MTDANIGIPMRKLFLIGANQGCVAICGDVAKSMGFIAWLKAGAHLADWKKKLYKGVGAIFVDKNDEPFWYDDSPHAVPIVAPCFAMGTGHVLATGAMKSGMSAMEAVKFAGSLDIYTSQDVEYYNAKTKKIKKYTSS